MSVFLDELYTGTEAASPEILLLEESTEGTCWNDQESEKKADVSEYQ